MIAYGGKRLERAVARAPLVIDVKVVNDALALTKARNFGGNVEALALNVAEMAVAIT